MNVFIAAARALIVLLGAAFPLHVAADFDDCDILRLTVTGTLPVNTAIQPRIDEDRLDGTVLRIPLDAIDATDADIRLRVRRTSDRIWVIDSLNSTLADNEQLKRFDLAMTRLEFDQDGVQLAEQQFEIIPQTASERGASARVVIEIRSIKLSGQVADIAVANVEEAMGPCSEVGFTVDANSNGGSPEWIFYSPEESLEAMRADGGHK